MNDVHVRVPYALMAGAVVAIAVYGSWYPFDFHTRPMSEAAWILVTSLRVGAPISLTDTAANLLLFFPLGFAAAGYAQRPRLRDVTAILAGAALLSSCIEYGQAFTMWRTPSLLDVAADTAGAAIGVAMWYPLAQPSACAMRETLNRWRAATRVERGLAIYAAIFAFAWLVPFDFTLRLDEIGDKYLHQRLLWPMSPSVEAATPFELLFTAIAAIPLGAAVVRCGCIPGVQRSFPVACAAGATGLLALTLLQVTVFSRTTDLTVPCAAVGGLVAGVLLSGPTPLSVP